MKKRNLKRIVVIVILLGLFYQFFTGSWNRRELSSLGIVGGVAITSYDHSVRITYQIINPISIQVTGESNKPVFYIQSEGKSIFEANRNATLQYSKKLYWPHLDICIFDASLAEKGLMEYLDYFNRNHESRRYMYLAVSRNYPSQDILTFQVEKEDVPSNYFEALFENSKTNGKSVSIKFIDFLKAYYAEGIEPVIGVIQTTQTTESVLKSLETELNVIPSAEGLAVFIKDEMVDFLDGDEARGYNFITGNIASTVLVAPSPDGKGVNSLEVIKADSKLDIKRIKDQYVGVVEVEINGMLTEETGEEDITNVQSIHAIEEATSKIVEDEMTATLQKVQRMKSDIFGFGQALHRKNPKEWKELKEDWNEIFASMTFEISVKTKVQRAGVSNQQLNIRE